METLRLRRIQEPSRVERILDAYISRASLLPDDAYQIRDPSKLPENLQVLLARALKEGHVWSCWASGSHLWLFTCHMSLALSRERGAPVILVQLYGADGELKDSGTWRFDPVGNWTRCAD
ncbi:MAG TPA: hypothetical protein VH111_07160 [Steroidobacteraceae bacterium]|jgi:hypothetical protein|nr:hypothetical protein [Steroidobacteraceae bacterium]